LQERGHKQLAKGAAAAHFVIIVTQLVLGCMWLWRPCDQLYLCRAQNAGFGIAYALMASQLIMAHMCKEPFQAPLWAIACLALGNLNKLLHWYDPLTVTLALDAALLAGYLHYVLVVISQICEHLDIYCLTVKRKPAADAE
jgi:ethanolaminephosphotransferase